MRPGSANASGAVPAQGRLRPQSAALLQLQQRTVQAPKGSAAASSDELIRDLEGKVRKVVELKRTESDRLRFDVGKRRDEVDKARQVLHDLAKDSEALGLRYHGEQTSPANERRGDDADSLEEEPDRLQPITSISRRPVYSKRTKISELEARLERRTKETHEIQRSTLVLEHIKRRLVGEHVEVTQATNELKAQFTDLSHETQELMKKDIAASDAVSQAQARLAQQKAEMAMNMRNYKRELEMRQKWAREKAKFEKYYNEQILAVQREAAASPNVAFELLGRPSLSPGRRRSALGLSQRSIDRSQTDDSSEESEACREAFLRIGFGHGGEEIDPRAVVQTFLSHEQLLKELDAQHSKDTERISQLQKQIAQSRSIASETVPLSKRGTSQRLETREVEISSVERALATVVDQYMFVDQSIRPIQIGLQQILQNVRDETVNVDDIDELERLLTESCDEMMRLVLEEPAPSITTGSSEDELAITTDDLSPVEEVDKTPESQGVFSAEEFTSPFNVRVSPKAKAPYFVLGIGADGPAKPTDDEAEEPDFNVMDRATVKRISSVLLCTSTGKKLRDNQTNQG